MGGAVSTIEKVALPALGALAGSAILPGIGTELGADIGGLGTVGGALGGLAGGAASGASGSGLLLDAASGGLAPNAGDILNGVGNGISDLYNGSDLQGAVNSIGIPDAASSIGSGLSNFADSTGLSQLFGGTAAPSSDLTNSYDAINSAAPNLDATAGATAPVDFASGGPSSSFAAGASSPGSAGVGGGTLAGFGGDPSNIGETDFLGSAQGGSTPDLGAGIGSPAPSSGLGNLFSSGNAGTGNYDINGNPAGASSYSPTQQISSGLSAGGNAVSSQTGAGGLSSLFSPGSALGGLLKAGTGYALNNNNSQGLNQITNATNQTQANYQPYIAAGQGAENTLANLYGNNGASAQTAAQQNFQNTPGYQFQLSQGLNALNANNAAMGQTLSGNAQEGINNYAQGVASQGYNNYVNQLNNMASGGLSATGGAGTAGLSGANAQATIGQNNANAQNTAIGTGLSSLFPGNSMTLQQLLGQNIGSGSGGSGLMGIYNSLFGS